MNIALLIGRLTKDPEVRYANEKAVARFSLAIDRGKDKDGKDLGADFPNVVAFGKTAENIEKYCHKGDMVAVTGKVNTGSYEKDGKKIYTTDIQASRVEFMPKTEKKEAEPMEGFARDESISFPWDF